MLMQDLTQLRNFKHLLDYCAENYGETTFVEYKTPDGIAKKTYFELKKAADAYSLMLEAKGLCGCHTAIVGPASFEWVAAFIGTGSTGSVSVPLSPSETNDMNRRLIEFSDSTVFVFDKAHKELYEIVKEQVPSVKTFISIDNTAPDSSVLNIGDIFNQFSGEYTKEPSPDDMCAIMFTSGTTGFPKGAMISHKNFIYTGTSVHKACPLPRVLGCLPLHHAFGLTGNITKTMVNARTLCINDSMQNIYADLKLYHPNGMLAVPQVVKYLMNGALRYAASVKDKMSEREAVQEFFGGQFLEIISGGAPLEADLNARYNETGVYVLNGYGMTECSPIIANNANGCLRHGSVGKPIPCMQIKFDNNEILLKGPNVMSGYYKNPEGTAKMFTPDGWLKTGDLGYMDEDGFLYITGRCKNLILLDNGENVSAEYIEEKFVAEPIVSEVMCYGDNGMIYAEIYPNKTYIAENGITDVQAEAEKVIKRVNSSLAAFQQINEFFLRDTPFERTASRKIKRGLAHTRLANKKQVFAGTPAERQVEAAVKELLMLKSVSMNDNFFAIGGNSLNAVELAVTLNIKPQKVYSCAILSKIAKAIEKQKHENHLRINNINGIIADTCTNKTVPSYKTALITGASGFLGIHILKQLSDAGITVYCLIRSEKRIENNYKHFFNCSLPKNVICLNGDIEEDLLGLSKDEYVELCKKIDTVFHIAANVQHAGDYTVLERTNVNGTENIIRFCLDSGAVLQHTSTVSVHGAATVIQKTEKAVFDENTLDIGQHFADNVYIHSKYRAEEKILTARLNGLKANIYRIGNLTWRSSDGKFQINVDDNGFIHRLRAIIKLGIIHENTGKYPIDLTPVDECADAYVKLALTGSYNRIFHLYNQNYLDEKTMFNDLNLPYRNASTAEMIEYAVANQSDKDIQVYLFYLIISGRSSEVDVQNNITVSMLKKLGFSWSMPNKRYLTLSADGTKGHCLDFEPFELKPMRTTGGVITPIQKLTLSVFRNACPKTPILIQGENSLKKLKDELIKANVKNPLVITVSFTMPQIEDFLNSFDKRPVQFNSIAAEPTVSDTDRALEAYIKNNCDAVVAIGGGSVLDTAKITALRASNPNRYIEDICKLDSECNAAVTLAAVPTTSGTGSEATLFAVATEEDENKKRPFTSDKFQPDIIVLDPVLTLSVPKKSTAYTGIDALSHAVEGYISLFSEAFSEDAELSPDVCKSIFLNLKNAYNNPNDIFSRSQMQLAAYNAGRAFGRIGTGYIHAIAHRFGEFYHVPHGLAIAVAFVPVLRAYLPFSAKQLAHLALYCDIGSDELSDTENAKSFIDAVESLISSFGITPSDIPFNENDLSAITAKAQEEAKVIGYPRPFSDKILSELIKSIFTQ